MDKDESAPNFYELSERSPLPETVWERRSESGGIGMMSGGASHPTNNVRIGLSSGAHFDFGDGMMDGYVGRSGGAGGGLDSANIINLIDSAYIQARQTSGGGGTGGVDSAYVLSVVDSATIPS